MNLGKLLEEISLVFQSILLLLEFGKDIEKGLLQHLCVHVKQSRGFTG